MTKVIKEELSEDVINEWKEDCREPRKRLLNDMLQKIDDLEYDLKEDIKEEENEFMIKNSKIIELFKK